ncbi:MAG: immunity 49 family protein [Flavobacteriaceae bacterium]
MKEIEDKIFRSKNRTEKVYNNFKVQKDFEDWHLATLSDLYSDLGYYFLIKNDLTKSKISFSTGAYIDMYLTRNYNKSHSRFLEFDIPRGLFPVFTDNKPMIDMYSKLHYQKSENAELSMDEMVLQGESAVWCNTIQFFMANDNEGIERNLNIIETLTLPKLPKNQQELKIDYEFYKALLSKDKSKCEELLEQLVSSKIHKKRNDNAVLSKYVSQPALGYAKLAWRQGLEVEVNSPLIPKEILPIEPLDNYEIPYDFLKEEFS